MRACAERERDARAPWSARERADRGRRATASCARGCALAVAHAMAVGVPAVGAEASSTPPSVSAVDMADAEAGPEIIMESRRESLRENVRELLVTRNVKHPELADGHFFPDEVDIELDMLGAPVMYWILGHVDRGDIVAVDNGGLLHAMMELVEEVPEP